MQKNDRLETKIRKKIEDWFTRRGGEIVVCIQEFCQGNRVALTPLMDLVKDLGSEVFADGKSLHGDLLDDIEYRIFELIGVYSSAPGGERLTEAINDDIIPRLTGIFAEAKRHWNLNYYKITESVHILDPENSIIADPPYERDNGRLEIGVIDDVRDQARDVIDRLIQFAKQKFKGEKNKKIAVSWLENPEKVSDISWLASLAGSSKGSTKVTLSRIKRSLLKHHDLKRIDDRLILSRSSLPLRQGGTSIDP